jgi:hypothetical protein
MLMLLKNKYFVKLDLLVTYSRRSSSCNVVTIKIKLQEKKIEAESFVFWFIIINLTLIIFIRSV